jgi:hypothetical protein
MHILFVECRLGSEELVAETGGVAHRLLLGAEAV